MEELTTYTELRKAIQEANRVVAVVCFGESTLNLTVSKAEVLRSIKGLSGELTETGSLVASVDSFGVVYIG